MGSSFTCKLNPCCGDRRNCDPPPQYSDRNRDEPLAVAPVASVKEALRKLANEVGGLIAFEPEVRQAIGHTNWATLQQRLAEADTLLSGSRVPDNRKRPNEWYSLALRFVRATTPAYDMDIPTFERFVEAVEAIAASHVDCPHNCDLGGVCLAEHAGYPKSCPLSSIIPATKGGEDAVEMMAHALHALDCFDAAEDYRREKQTVPEKFADPWLPTGVRQLEILRKRAAVLVAALSEQPPLPNVVRDGLVAARSVIIALIEQEYNVETWGLKSRLAAIEAGLEAALSPRDGVPGMVLAPADAFAKWLEDGPRLAKAAGCYVGIKVSALSTASSSGRETP